MYYFREHVTSIFFSLRKSVLENVVSLCTPENSAIQKLSIIIIYIASNQTNVLWETEENEDAVDI